MYKKILAAGMAAFLVFGCFGCENSSYPLDPMAKDGTYVMETVPAVLKETEYFRIQINSNPVEQADGRFPFFYRELGRKQEKPAGFHLPDVHRGRDLPVGRPGTWRKGGLWKNNKAASFRRS